VSRSALTVVLGIVAVWIVAHLLAIDPLQDAAERTLLWGVVIATGSVLIAAVTVLAVALARGATNLAWLRVVHVARTLAAVIGATLVVLGLLRYRDTAPHGEIQVVVAGLVVLVAAGLVHGWLVVTERRFR
jgi:hypothetical protein